MLRDRRQLYKLIASKRTPFLLIWRMEKVCAGYKLTTKKAVHTWQGLKYRSPAQGIVDSGLDISVMGGERAAVAHLQKKDFKVADKVAHTYLENALQAA